jgi:glutamate dehydrogenase
VVLAYAKMSVFDELLASNLPDDPHFNRALKAYFPKVLSERFPAAVDNHPLKREIIATTITNTVLNRTGATFVNFLAAESVATAADVVRAFTLAREVFDLERLWDQLDALDYKVRSQLQLDMLSKLTAIAQRASRWMMRARADNADLSELVSRYQPAATAMRSQLRDWLPEGGRASWQAASDALCDAGVETALAQDLSALEFIFPALDLVNLARSAGTTLEMAARTYFSVDAELGLTGWRTEINRLPTDTLWQTQARGSARDDVYSIASQITLGLLSRKETIADWRQRHEAAIRRLNQLLTMVSAQGADLAPVSVAMRELRQLA